MVEPGTAKVYLPYVYDIELLCWVWRKWKLILITVVDWMATWRLHHNHSPGSLLLILVHRTVTYDFVAHHASQICGMVVTAIYLSCHRVYHGYKGCSSKSDLQFVVTIAVMVQSFEITLTSHCCIFVPRLMKINPALRIICPFYCTSAYRSAVNSRPTVYLSRCDIVLKWLNWSPCHPCCMVAEGF